MDEKMKILIGYDGSESSDAMLDDLRRAGLPAEADVFVASIAEIWLPMQLNYGGVEPSYVDETISGVAQARHLAEKAAERLRADFPGWTVGHDATSGSPSGVLLTKAESWKPDLIIVGSEGHSAIGRFFFGSVSQSVLLHAPCSVRVSRPASNESAKDSPVRLVIGVDGSEQSTAAVNSIIARNWAKGSEVRVVCAMARLLAANLHKFDLDVPSKLEETDYYQREKARLDKIVAEAQQKLEEAGFAVSSVIETEDPKKLLIARAEEWKADCIFVGATGLSRIERLLLGSVSSAVETDCASTVGASSAPISVTVSA